MRILVTGATGLAGAEILRQAITDNEISEVIALVRNEPAVKHPKIKTIIHKDFLNYDGLEELIISCNSVLWCLGISQTQVNKEKYYEITYDYTVKAAEAFYKFNPGLRFTFLSGNGADRTGKSRVLFAKIKGITENALLARGYSQLYIVRPDAINPIHKNPKAPFLYKLAYPFFPLVEKFTPSKIISADVLARAMLKIAKYGNEKDTFENMELREMGK